MTFCFFVGNKRSGTTLFNRALNLHPNFYSCHEADIINWILGTESKQDWVEGLDKTRELLGTKPDSQDSNTLIQVLETLRSLDPLNAYKQKILCYGDKKPVQHLEQSHIDFVNSVGGAKYIHLIRHPLSFLNSTVKLSERYDIRIWGEDCEEILEFWAKNVEKAEVLGKTVRLEDFVEKPEETLCETFSFLQLPEMTNLNVGYLKINKKDMSGNFNFKPKSKKVKSLAEKYGYEI